MREPVQFVKRIQARICNCATKRVDVRKLVSETYMIPDPSVRFERDDPSLRSNGIEAQSLRGGERMTAKIHAHLLSELDRSGRADTIFSICAAIFDMLVFCVGSIIASISKDKKDMELEFIFYILISGAVVVTIAALAGLINGQRMCNAYQMAFIDMYKKEQVAEYYPISAISAGKMRNSLYFLVIIAIGIISISIPLIIHSSSHEKPTSKNSEY